MAFGTVNADVIGTSVAGSNLGAGNASIMKNRIINGAMVIDQRNAGASVTIPTATSTYTLDRWFAYASVGSKFTVQQNAGSITPPVGFTNYLGVTSLSAYSVGASESFDIHYRIEGYNTADLGWGTANAKTVTLSFQVYSSLTGSFGGSLYNSATNRWYPFSYTVSTASTWTAVSVTIAGDTSGTWLTTNGIGLGIIFSLGIGSTLSGTAGAWTGSTYLQPTGSVSVVGTSGATFYITGVQLEVGSSQTGYEYVNYQTSLANCQRYYQRFSASASYTNAQFGVGIATSTTGAQIFMKLSTTMRSVPSLAYSNVAISDATSSAAVSSVDALRASTDTIGWAVQASGASFTVGRAASFYANSSASGYIDFSSEL